MVRTPLARRIDADEALNSVSLFLPHYDPENLDKVVAKLTGGDPDTSLPIEVRRGEDVVDLTRAPKSDPWFAALSALPSYFVPKSRRTSEVKRLVKLAFLLSNDGLDAGATDKAWEILLRVLDAEYAKRKETEAFRKFVTDAASVETGGRRVRLGVAEEGELEEKTLTRAIEDIDEQFEEAGKRFGDGLHKRWWRSRVERDESAIGRSKLEAIALALDLAVPAALEESARTTTQAWLRRWRAEIKALPESDRAGYAEIKGMATRSELIDREPYPDVIQVTNAERQWKAHMYIDPAGKFPSKFNKWETRVIGDELAKKETVGWLRNPPRKPWSLTIPYWREGEEHPQYPDFLVLRRDRKGNMVVDLLEPHMTDLADAAPKAFGLAQYADAHADAFGRIEFIVVDGDDVMRLDLADERWRQKVLIVGEGGDAAKLRLVLKEAAASAAIAT